MKQLILTVFLFIAILSCKNNSANNAEETPVNDKTEITKAKDCDEFINQYEKWMDDYLSLIDKYMKNPLDNELMQEYSKVAQEGMDWMTQWNSKLIFCAGQEKYEKRFNEISERAEKKLEEMGIE